MTTATVKVENQSSSKLHVLHVTKVTVETSTKPSNQVTVDKLLSTISSNRRVAVDAPQNALVLITSQSVNVNTKTPVTVTLQSEDVLFEVGTSGGNVLIGSGTTLTKALMWAFFAMMIALIIVVIVLLVVHFKRVHEQDKVAAAAADALVATNDATKAHPPVAEPAKAYTQGHHS